jgi:hypothetical protein
VDLGVCQNLDGLSLDAGSLGDLSIHCGVGVDSAQGVSLSGLHSSLWDYLLEAFIWMGFYLLYHNQTDQNLNFFSNPRLLFVRKQSEK